MTFIFLTEYNTRCYAVSFKNKGWIKLQNFEDDSLDKNIIYTVNPLETFLGKSESSKMTAISGRFNKKVFDGNTILLKISEECDQQRYAYIGGELICSFMTNDNIYEYISNMGNNLTPYNIAIS